MEARYPFTIYIIIISPHRIAEAMLRPYVRRKELIMSDCLKATSQPQLPKSE
jgi:hypothetical protein